MENDYRNISATCQKKIINMHDIEMEEKKTLHFIHTLLVESWTVVFVKGIE